MKRIFFVLFLLTFVSVACSQKQKSSRTESLIRSWSSQKTDQMVSIRGIEYTYDNGDYFEYDISFAIIGCPEVIEPIAEGYRSDINVTRYSEEYVYPEPLFQFDVTENNGRFPEYDPPKFVVQDGENISDGVIGKVFAWDNPLDVQQIADNCDEDDEIEYPPVDEGPVDQRNLNQEDWFTVRFGEEVPIGGSGYSRLPLVAYVDRAIALAPFVVLTFVLFIILIRVFSGSKEKENERY